MENSYSEPNWKLTQTLERKVDFRMVFFNWFHFKALLIVFLLLIQFKFEGGTLTSMAGKKSGLRYFFKTFGAFLPGSEGRRKINRNNDFCGSQQLKREIGEREKLFSGNIFHSFFLFFSHQVNRVLRVLTINYDQTKNINK